MPAFAGMMVEWGTRRIQASNVIPAQARTHASLKGAHRPSTEMALYSIDRSLPPTPELAAVVEEAYALFAPYSIGSALYVCHCNVCMTRETERQLTATPLREIPAPLLAQYTNSAHDWNDGQVAREMRYFLPRYLDLIARNDPPDDMGMEICLRRLASAQWRTTWPKAEADLIARFFDALVRGAMLRLDVIPWEREADPKANMEDILTMIVRAGGDLTRALAVWDDGPVLGAAVQMAKTRASLDYKHGRDILRNAHLEDQPDAGAEIAAFLLRPCVQQRIEAAFFATDDPHLQKILSNAAG